MMSERMYAAVVKRLLEGDGGDSAMPRDERANADRVIAALKESLATEERISAGLREWKDSLVLEVATLRAEIEVLWGARR
jgi:predicted lipoprotein